MNWINPNLPPPSEFDIQCQVIEWANLSIGKYPELEWLHSSLNGIPLMGNAHQRARIIQKSKAAGMKPGVSDLCLPSARGGYFFFYMEMKKKGGRLREGQAEFLKFISAEGGFDAVCYSFEEAVATLEWYCSQSRTQAVKQSVAVRA